MTENYIFDFGNVITRFYPDELTAPYISDETLRKRISDVVFDRIYWDRLDEASITDDEIKEDVCARVDDDMRDIACRIYDDWVKNLTPVEGMEKLISDIHKSGKKLFLLSNISLKFAEEYESVKWIKEVFKNFDGIVLSATVGRIKPNPDIFEYVLETYGLNPEECLFIDDSAKNIEGAESAGIKGYLFDGDAGKLRQYIGL